MARLPGDKYVIQQIDGMVILYDIYSEKEIIKFDPSNQDATAKAQGEIYNSTELNDEEKSFAHFWSGYFYAHSGHFSTVK